MKKEIKISLGIIIIIIIVIIAIIGVLSINRKEKDYLEEYEDYYTTTYSASYNTSSILEKDTYYELVNSEGRMKEILGKTKDDDIINTFNSNFFENSQLLFIEGGIDSTINKLKVSNKHVNITIYSGSPLTSVDEIHDFDLYVIPVNKNIEFKDVKIVEKTYPNRMY